MKDIYGDAYTDEEYNAISWAGLDEIEIIEIPREGDNYFSPITEAWASLSELEKQKIRDIKNDLKINCDESCD